MRCNNNYNDDDKCYVVWNIVIVFTTNEVGVNVYVNKCRCSLVFIII